MTSSTETNPLRIKGLHHVELWVGNAKQAAYFYRKAFGFSQLGYSGLETGDPKRTRYVLAQGKIRLILSTALTPDDEINDHTRAHGDGVRDIAFEVFDARAAFARAVELGATPVAEPHEHTDASGTVVHAAIATYGDTIHSFYSKVDYNGFFLPYFQEKRVEETSAGLRAIDHIVGNVEQGAMDTWASWYEKVMGFHRYITFDDKDISTEFTALQSVVMSDPDRVFKMPINEPATGRKKSQIQEYIDFYGTPGVQHVALLTFDIVSTIKALVANGVEFLHVPDTYYDNVNDRVGRIEEDVSVLKTLGILIDRDDEGYLLQLFTKPVEDRPTMFFEIIQRKGARGFGKGNFKALFESIEHEQAARGTL